MERNIIKIVEDEVNTAGGTDIIVQELFHKKPVGHREVQKLRVSVIVESVKVNDFLTYMNGAFGNIKLSRNKVMMYADNNPMTEEWEIEITFVGDNM